MSMVLKNIADSLTEEQKALAKKCKSPEEFLKLAAGEMIELSDEQLELVAGGNGWDDLFDCSCFGHSNTPRPRR